ncbi:MULTISPECIES: histidine-type phosphatase [Nitrospirillum]|uniref:4-phytase/acid phosphatase n=1 Tax=Nitrospirillum amazonense TaxID=28077 RepID=A0A560FAB4_9PROT|nr:histidine-type phosphatase [Nitrospirillum amazonense]MEC4595122.1 histidine-type phosphatase [Nitrospirillum amazonense]TWB18544.1 4-phytase/acid phosphatase [Nitrospirillum amazonense]
MPVVLAAGLMTGPAWAEAPATPQDGMVLERVVMLSRHGVRSPTKGLAELRRLSDQDWPAWPVDRGILTPHGADAIRQLGLYLGAQYRQRGLLAADRCPAENSIFVWGDSGDQRTRASAQALAEGLAPGCGLKAHGLAPDSPDVLFDAASGGACPMDADEATKAMVAANGGDIATVPANVAPALAALVQVVAPKACAPRGPSDSPAGACFATGPAKVVDKGGEVKVDGPLARGAMLAESVFLEYVQGMPADQVGWGRAGTPQALAAILPVHDYQADLTRRTPYIASHNGALLARQIVAGVTGEAPAAPLAPPLAPVPAGARLISILGHDTNLSNVAGLLGLDWTLPSQPDKTAPDTTLAFEVSRDTATGKRYVRVALYYQTLEDLRQAAALTPAHPAGKVDLPLPACGGDRCTVEDFATLVRKAVPAACWR